MALEKTIWGVSWKQWFPIIGEDIADRARYEPSASNPDQNPARFVVNTLYHGSWKIGLATLGLIGYLHYWDK